MPCRHCGCRGPCLIAWSCAPTLSGICQLAANCPYERDKMPRARGPRQAAMPPEWRGAWTDGRAERSTIFLERLGGTGRSATSSVVRSKARPLLEVVTVVSRGTNIFWNVVACPPRASERVQGWSAGGDKCGGCEMQCRAIMCSWLGSLCVRLVLRRLFGRGALCVAVPVPPF